MFRIKNGIHRTHGSCTGPHKVTQWHCSQWQDVKSAFKHVYTAISKMKLTQSFRCTKGTFAIKNGTTNIFFCVQNRTKVYGCIMCLDWKWLVDYFQLC